MLRSLCGLTMLLALSSIVTVGAANSEAQATRDGGAWGIYARLPGAKVSSRSWAIEGDTIIEKVGSNSFTIRIDENGRLERRSKGGRLWLGTVEPDGAIVWAATTRSFADYSAPDFRMSVEDGNFVFRSVAVKDGVVGWTGAAIRTPIAFAAGVQPMPAMAAAAPPARTTDPLPQGATEGQTSVTGSAPAFIAALEAQPWGRLGTGGWDRFSMQLAAFRHGDSHILNWQDEYGRPWLQEQIAADSTTMIQGKKSYPLTITGNSAVTQISAKQRNVYEIKDGQLTAASQRLRGGTWQTEGMAFYTPLTGTSLWGVFDHLAGYTWGRTSFYLDFVRNTGGRVTAEFRVAPTLGGMDGPKSVEILQPDPANPGWFYGVYSGATLKPDTVMFDLQSTTNQSYVYQLIGNKQFARYRSATERDLFTLEGAILKQRFQVLQNGSWGPGKTDGPNGGYDYARFTLQEKQALVTQIGAFRKRAADDAAQDRHMAFMNGLTGALNAANDAMASQVAQSSANLNATLDSMRMQQARQQMSGTAGGGAPLTPGSIRATAGKAVEPATAIRMSTAQPATSTQSKAVSATNVTRAAAQGQRAAATAPPAPGGTSIGQTSSGATRGATGAPASTKLPPTPAPAFPPPTKQAAAPTDHGPARAWCQANQYGNFQCMGPLQKSGSWVKPLSYALDLVGCAGGKGYNPTPGGGGSGFDCGRRLRVGDLRMPTYDPYRGGGEPQKVREDK